MKYTFATLRTKTSLAISLKQKMSEKPLTKITIAELISECNMNRRTFYYHFEDFYELVDWMFEQEGSALFQRSIDCKTWEDGVVQLFQYVQENEDFCKYSLVGPGREYLRKMFKNSLVNTAGAIVLELSQGMEIEHSALDFITMFYAGAVAEAVMQWLSEGFRKDPEELLPMLNIVTEGNIRSALQRAAKTPVVE